MRGSPGPRNKLHEMSLQRMAMQMAGQLPERPEDARAVIAYMSQILDIFVDPPAAERPTLSVIGGDRGS